MVDLKKENNDLKQVVAELYWRNNWHVEDRGIRHVYIKARTPQLNGKVERSHRSDQDEFYQLLEYRDDVDLEKSWPNGRIFIILPGRMVPTKEKPLTHRSESG